MSEGREFLEEQAFDFALGRASVSAIAVVEPCAEITNAPEDSIKMARFLESRNGQHVYVDGVSTLMSYRPVGARHFVCQIIEPSEAAFAENYDTNLCLFSARITQLIEQ